MRKILKILRWPYFVVLSGVTLYMGLQCLNLQVDEENRSMQSDNSVADALEAQFYERFEEGEPIIVAIHRQDLFQESGKKYANQLIGEFREIEGVKEVISLADRDYTFPAFYEGFMVSADVSTMGVRIFTDHPQSDASVIAAITAVARANSRDGSLVKVSGLPVQKNEASRLVVKDQKLFAPVSIVVLGGVLLFVTGRLSGVLCPLIVAAITTVWTLGLYSLSGLQLNMITSLLAPVILTLSVSTVLHVYIQWLKEDVTDCYLRIANAIRSLWRPCLFASLTTAFGFLSLLLSETPAVRQFGAFAALGVVLAWVLGFTFLFFGLSLFQSPSGGVQNRWIFHTPAKCARIAITHPWKTILASIILSLVALAGMAKIQVNTDLLGFLGPRNQVYQDSMYINSNLTGINTVEVLLSKNTGQPVAGKDDFDRIRGFHEAIKKSPGVRHVMSAASFLDGVSVTDENAEEAWRQISSDRESRFVLDSEKMNTRVSIRVDPQGSLDGADLIEDIQRIGSKELGSHFELRISGGFVRVVEESNQLVMSQIKSFGLALGLILIAIGIVFRSVQLMVLSVIPNLVPLLITGAVMGVLHIDLSTGTAMIAGVVIGVSVDDTIHYITGFRNRVIAEGCDRAVMETSLSSGAALFSTTLALSLGFWVAAMGSFKPTIYFALLSGLTMWIALLCDILILPAFLKITYKKCIGTTV